MGYNEGFETGYKTAPNPFSPFIDRVDEARARKAADDKDLKDLKNLFVQMGMKHEYDKSLENQKGKQERLNELFKGFSSGQIQLPDEQADRLLSEFGLSTSPQTQGTAVQEQAPTGTSPMGIAESAGLTKKRLGTSGVSVTESPDAYKKRLEIQKLERDLRPEEEKRSEEMLSDEAKQLAKIKPNLDRAIESVNQLKELFAQGDVSKSVKKGDIIGGLMERIGGIGEGAVAHAGGNAPLKKYLNLRQSFSSLITKGAFLEVGVLTNPDIERALKALPTTMDTAEEIEIGWKVLEEVLQKAIKRYNLLKSGKSVDEINQGESDKLLEDERKALIEKIRKKRNAAR